jgi:hypothetical protein
MSGAEARRHFLHHGSELINLAIHAGAPVKPGPLQPLVKILRLNLLG